MWFVVCVPFGVILFIVGLFFYLMGWLMMPWFMIILHVLVIWGCVAFFRHVTRDDKWWKKQLEVIAKHATTILCGNDLVNRCRLNRTMEKHMSTLNMNALDVVLKTLFQITGWRTSQSVLHLQHTKHGRW